MEYELARPEYKGAMESCCTAFDEKLLKIPHYIKHPEMLPFVGKSYQEMKEKGKKTVLLVGESHYIEGADASNGEKHFEEVKWYDDDGFSHADGFKKGNIFFDHFDFYVTRHIVSNFLKGEDGSGYTIFSNPLRAYWGEVERQNYHKFAFMNYFQSPAFARGKSKDPSEKDLEVAKATLEKVIEFLAPDVVIFLSKKAFWAYIGSEKYQVEKTAEHRFLYCKKDGDKPDFYAVSHPTCPWWNRSGGRYGRAAFKHILEEAWGAPQLLPPMGK